MIACVITLLVLLHSNAFGIVGDLNPDGTVDFDDFFVFSDHFGETGEVSENDCQVVYIDTITVQDPKVREYQTWEDVYDVIDIRDPWDGLRSEEIEYTTERFRLGPELSFTEHSLVTVTFFEGVHIKRVEYLIPSGHIITEEIWSENILQNARRLEDGTISAYVNIGDESEVTRYLYDLDMKVIDIEVSMSRYGRPDVYFYFEELAPGRYDVYCRETETSKDYCNGAWLDGYWTHTPLDMDVILRR